MTSEQLQGKWQKMKGNVKQQWGRLTDDDIETIAGKRDVLIGRLQERYGVTKEAATRDADSWLKTMGESAGHEREHEHKTPQQYAGRR
jgi:uncharacterized protein YjbJ (UPF0337 family)